MPSSSQIGLHISAAKSLDLSFDRAREIGCSTFQIFTRNPRMWRFSPLTEDQVTAFREKRKTTGFKSVVAHMPYLPNLSSPDKATMKISRYTLAEEVKRCDALGIDYLVTHLGSHMGKGAMVGVKNVSESVKLALDQSTGSTIVLLENMAGQKNSVGSRFEELRMILDRIPQGERTGICFDTCHAFAAGFDLSGKEAVEDTMNLFAETVGEEKLRVVHLNDSKGGLGDRLDRHEYVGEGKIGKEGMRALLHYHEVKEKPLIMETPFEDENGMKKSLAVVRSLLR